MKAQLSSRFRCAVQGRPRLVRQPTKLTLILLLAAGCATQKPPPSALPSCGPLYRGQRISEACAQEAKRALDDSNTSQLDHWRALAVIQCPVKGVISTDNDRVSFECIYDLQKVGELSPPPWWLRPLKPLIAGINWSLKSLFQLISPLIAG
jgi:hypothetical protein